MTVEILEYLAHGDGGGSDLLWGQRAPGRDPLVKADALYVLPHQILQPICLQIGQRPGDLGMAELPQKIVFLPQGILPASGLNFQHGQPAGLILNQVHPPLPILQTGDGGVLGNQSLRQGQAVQRLSAVFPQEFAPSAPSQASPA